MEGPGSGGGDFPLRAKGAKGVKLPLLYYLLYLYGTENSFGISYIRIAVYL